MPRLFASPTFLLLVIPLSAAGLSNPLPHDPDQSLERTCFQTGQAWSEIGNLRSDVAIVYGIDAGLQERIRTWRDRGYRIHVMTGVSWGNYQDYLYGRFDGVNHEDEAQTDRTGNKISHGGDVYYMCPGTNYGKFLCVGVQRALDAGAEAIHLEEPEFWVRGGYSEGFRREWRQYYGEDWQPPHSSVDAQWRASKLKYHLYRRALQQVFDHVRAWNQRTGHHVRCYVPTHSLLNYAHWRIVSPESSLARLDGCDGYIAQVWTGTARTPNLYRGQLRERTFETAFLEYGAMQNLVRATGRTVWYLNDPVEDNPDHDWEDYRVNWESTMVASLFQPEVWRYEVAPWPERVFGGRYPKRGHPEEREPIPPAYATEVQTVINALNDMKQEQVAWDCGTTGIGVLVSDSLMFQRGEPYASEPHLSQIYGLALPFLKRGMPVTPVQLENLTVPGCLEGLRVLLLTYHGMKPLTPEVHAPLAAWVKRGGLLVVCDDDTDPYNRVREWWNTGGRRYATPRGHLFEELGLPKDLRPPGNHGPAIAPPVAGRDEAGSSEFARSLPPRSAPAATELTFMETRRVGGGAVVWLRENPAQLAASAENATRLVQAVKEVGVGAGMTWRETNYLLLRRGPYVIASGLDESIEGEPNVLRGHLVNLFDPELRARDSVTLTPGSRWFLLDLEAVRGRDLQVLASACKPLVVKRNADSVVLAVEGVAHTQAVVLLHSTNPPRSVTLAGTPLSGFLYSPHERLLWIRFANEATPRDLSVHW
jgi:hypothetical protein